MAVVTILNKADGVEYTYAIDNRLKRALDTQVKENAVKKDEDFVFLVDGGERCQPAGSLVLMADGSWKKIEDIQNGDLIISPQLNGKNIFSKVKRTFNYNSSEVMDVIQLNKNKSKLYSCNSNHLIPMNIKIEPRLNGKRPANLSYWDVRNYTASNLSLLSKSFKKDSTTLSSFAIESYNGIKNCLIEPYSLGVFLGDGSFCGSRLNITSQDEDIINEVKKHYNILHIAKKKGTSALDYSFGVCSLFSKQLEQEGLRNKRSGNKFIPKSALLSDLNYRKRLLAGLIDTDGYLSKKGGYSITTKSKQLAEDISNLIYSIGGRASIKQIKKGIKAINFVGIYYNVSFYIGNMKLDLMLDYKIKKTDTWYISPNRISIDVINKRSCDVYGFELDSLSGLYITDNWMITHNTGKSVLAQQQALYLSAKPTNQENYYIGNLPLEHVCMNALEFKEAIQTSRKGDVIIYDEAYNGLSARGALTEINNILIGLMMEMGQKNLYVIIVLPTFFMLEKYVALFRARGLFHVYRKNGKRGFWTYFNQQRKNVLYIKGKKFLSYAPPPYSNMKGRFSDKYCVNEEEYRKKKRDALEGNAKGTKTSERWKIQRDRLIYCIHKELGLNRSEIKQLIKGYDVFLGTTQIRDILVICDKLQEKRDSIETKQLNIREKSFKDTERLKIDMENIAKENNIKEEEYEEEEDDTLIDD